MKKKFNIARQPKSLVAATAVILLALTAMRAFMLPYPVETTGLADMPLGIFIDGLGAQYPTLVLAVSAVMILLNAILVTRIVDKYSISETPTYLPIVMYVIASCGLFFPAASLSAPLASLLLTFSTGQIIASFKRTHTFSNVFHSAVWLGVIPLLYSPAIVLAVILIVTLVLYARSWREAIVGLAGLGIPFVLTSTIGWFAGGGWSDTGILLFDKLLSAGPQAPLSVLLNAGIPAVAFAGIFVALVLYSVFLVFLNMHRMRTRVRKIYIHAIFLLAVAFSTLFFPSATIFSLGLIAVPASLVSTVFFMSHKGMLALGIYLLVIFAAIAVNILPFIGIF